MRSELSKKSKVYMERNRYLELKYFCRQYPIWKKAYAGLDSLAKKPEVLVQVSGISDPVSRCAEARAFYAERIKLVEETAMMSAPGFYEWLIKGVTEGKSYDILSSREVLPVSRAEYYSGYRTFFWLLNEKRA